MSDLSATNLALQDLLSRIETNRLESEQHRLNANVANAGAALTYLFTRGSERRIVRTVGSVAAVGGVLYASSEGSTASNLETQNNFLIDAALSVVETRGVSIFRAESNRDVVRKFLDLALLLGRQVDGAIAKQGKRLKNRSLLWMSSRQLLMNAANVDVVGNKLRLNGIFNRIDRTKTFPDFLGSFHRQISAISTAKLKKEALYAKLTIGTLSVAGIMLANIFPAGAALFWLGIGFWIFDYFFPVFPETRKLKVAVTHLVDGLQQLPPILSLSVS